jgi:hypothetical protein
MTQFLRRLLARLTYANVTATLALIAAMGTGSAYAATQLANNSVGSKQIRTGAVRSPEVKNRSLQVRDLSRKARKSLRGNTGPQGPAGPAGTAFRAALSDGCGRPVGNSTGADPIPGGGGCTVRFGSDVSQCVYSATLAAVFNGAGSPDPGAGRINVASGGGNAIVVRTYDAAGRPAALGFHLIVAC